MTESAETFDRSVMMSSVMPSAKYSCSGSPLMLANGSTAIDGFRLCRGPGIVERAGCRVARLIRARRRRPEPAARCSSASVRPCPRRRGRAGCRHGRGPCPRRQMPPGSAMPSSRAATLTPSPKMSSSSTMTSPRLTPMRNSMRRSCGTSALRSPSALDLGGAGDGVHDARELHQHAVAGELDDAPLVLGDLGVDQLLAMRIQRGKRGGLVGAHQAAVADHVGGQDSGEQAVERAGFSHEHGLFLRDTACPKSYWRCLAKSTTLSAAAAFGGPTGRSVRCWKILFAGSVGESRQCLYMRRGDGLTGSGALCQLAGHRPATKSRSGSVFMQPIITRFQVFPRPTPAASRR